MKRIVLFILAFVLMIGCAEDEEKFTPPRDLNTVEQQLANTTPEFGFELLANSIPSESDKNVLVSPMSVSFALGMTLAGANGQTATDMSTTLGHDGMSQEEINEGYRGLMTLLTSMDPKVQFELANSLWIQEGFGILDTFIATCADYFLATAQELDLLSSDSVDSINDWVNENTHGKIETILDGPLNPGVVMYLVNALYFKGDWTNQFDKGKTSESAFNLADGTTTPVMMMRRTGYYKVHQETDFVAVQIPYGNEVFAMTLLMPRSDLPLSEFVGSLNAAKWQETTEAMPEQKVMLSVPRFELEYGTDLVDQLSVMGMDLAFSELADFSGMDGKGNLLISEVRHKTYMKVNEEGTEAAAATSVGMQPNSAPPSIIFDRPFVLVLHDVHTKAVMFAGVLARP